MQDESPMTAFVPDAQTTTVHLNLEAPQSIQLPRDYVSFYVSDEPGEDGWPQNGTLFENAEFTGQLPVSIFDPVLKRSAHGLFLHAKDQQGCWTFQRQADAMSIQLSAGDWELTPYAGNEPDWQRQPCPFRNLPTEDEESHHAKIRGLLDFCAATRTREDGSSHYQAPNSMIGKGYQGDGIPDTFFHFISVFDCLSEQRQAWFAEQFQWLGDHIRFDGCIPWGSTDGEPYFNIWLTPELGLFFDGNGLWLDVMKRLAERNFPVDLTTVIRAADFYLHYLSPAGNLVAAQRQMKGCEWADLIQNGWESGLVNVLACHGLDCAASIIRMKGEEELAERYEAAAQRLKKAINLPVEQGGLWMGNGFVDWVGPDGEVVKTWRVDANMLAVVWDVATPDHARQLFQFFKDKVAETKPPVPFPYLIEGRWDEPVDHMLNGCRAFGCGTDAMPGRMGGTAAAAAYKLGDTETGDRILEQLKALVNDHEFVYEKYKTTGEGYGCYSYIEHVLSVLLVDSLRRG